MRSLAMALTLFAGPAMAQNGDFSEGSEAKSWNLYAETPARFEARVVDIICELSGDCPDECGGGARQLGLLRSADDVLVFPNKNGQPLFTGAAAEMLPFCNKDVEVDGLMIEDPDLGAANVYLLQTIREVGAEEWVKADRWTEVWDEEHPDAGGDGPWFRRDPAVAAEIEEEGYFGYGPERDAELKAEIFQ